VVTNLVVNGRDAMRPRGAVAGLAVAVSFFGTAWTERTLIRFAFAFEQGTKQRRGPALLPAVSFDVPAAKAK